MDKTMLLLLISMLFSCKDPVTYKHMPLPEGVFSCDTASYEDRSEKVLVHCRRTDGQVTLMWSTLEAIAGYGEWTVDPPWGQDVANITDSDCDTRTGICAITTRSIPVSDTQGAVYAQMVDNPPEPWYKVLGTEGTGWTAIAASSGYHRPPPLWPDYSYPWVLGTIRGILYAAQPPQSWGHEWLIHDNPGHPCGGGGPVSGIYHSLDDDNPIWLSSADMCTDWSIDPAPGRWLSGSHHNMGWMHTRNVVYDPLTNKWLAATDTLYSSADNGVTWVARPRSIFQGLGEDYLVWLVGDGTQLWALGEQADRVWQSANGGRSFTQYKTWIPGELMVSSAVFVHTTRYDADLVVIIATDYRADRLHIAAMWDPGS